jgi:hypothetical protein
MTDQHSTSPYAIERRLLELDRLLDEAHNELRGAEEKYHTAKATFEVAFARAFMSADEKNAEACKQSAVLATEEERKTLALAEALVRAARANASRLEQQVDITRSVGRLVTSAMNL